MPVTCHCSSCGATYQVDQQFVGRKIKCPKCAAAILVAAAADAKRLATAAQKTAAGAKPLKTAARIESDEPPPVPPLRRQRAAVPEPLVPGGLEIPGLSDAAPSYASGSRSVPKLPPRRKPGPAGNRGLWIGVGVGAGGLIVVGLVVTVIVLLMPATKPPVAAKDTAKTAEKPHKDEAPKPPPAPAANTLILNWMESERDGAELFLDGQPVGVPKTDTVKLSLPVGPRPTRSASRAKATSRWSSTAVRSKAKTNLTTP